MLGARRVPVTMRLLRLEASALSLRHGDLVLFLHLGHVHGHHSVLSLTLERLWDEVRELVVVQLRQGRFWLMQPGHGLLSESGRSWQGE